MERKLTSELSTRQSGKVVPAVSLDRNEPVLHWCDSEDAYLIIPVDVDERGRRIGECPYCGRLVWDNGRPADGWSAAVFPPNLRRP